MERKKRNRGGALERVMARITPQEHARVFKQMAIAARIADALEAKGWSKSEFAGLMNQQPSVITRWLSGTQNFTIDTLSDIEEMLGVQLLVTDTKPASTVEKPRAEPIQERIIEHHYVPVFYNAEPVTDGCLWSETTASSRYTVIINPSPSLN